TCLADVMPCAEELDATVIDMRFVKPLDTACLEALAKDHSLLVSVEDNAIAGGAGSAIAEYLQAQQINLPLLQCGLPDSFIKHGTQDEIRAELGLDSAGLLKRIQERVAKM
ncbi:1-deoxy-D-xylulose-5-phosphate synthase, partial [Pseudidiomarina aestuarii]